jgi:hypothetical protein
MKNLKTYGRPKELIEGRGEERRRIRIRENDSHRRRNKPKSHKYNNCR